MKAKPIEIEDARRIVLERIEALASEPVALRDALGRVLAEPVSAVDPIPSFDNSAMDGFAVRSADVPSAVVPSAVVPSADVRSAEVGSTEVRSGDVHGAGLEAPVRLSLVGESRGGHPSQATVDNGQAVAISTGAMMPAGADAVVAVERTRLHDGRVEVLADVSPGDYVRPAGGDLRAGQPVLSAGTVLGPAQLGMLAALGRAEVACARRPRVAVLVTGDELVAPGLPLRPGEIYDSNAHSIPALVTRAGGEPVSVTSVPDDLSTTRGAIAQAIEHADVTVICGGVSVGAHDHVRQSLAELSVSERFWGVALKPGKPTWFGTRGERLVFGLPGNPVSAIVTFTLLVAPALRALSGATSSRRRLTATIARDHDKAPGRAHALRCRLLLGDDGWRAEPGERQGSHVLSSMLDADALAIIPSGQGSVRAGDRVQVELLDDALPGLA